MSEERRREPRLDTLSLSLFVYDNLTGELLGTLVNLSRGGMMILSGQPCDPGGALQIDLRRSNDSGNTELSAAIRINWVSPASTSGSYWVGARIIGLAEEDTERLERLLQTASD